MTSFSLDKFEDILKKSEGLEKQLNEELTSDEYVRFSKEYSEIQPLVSEISEWKKTSKEISDLEILLEDKNNEEEMKELAEEEFKNLADHLSKVEENIKLLLLPKDKADSKDVILEIRAGTGGDEAAIFAGDLFRMYQRFADLNKWKTQVMTLSDGDVGGYKEIIFSISGEGTNIVPN